MADQTPHIVATFECDAEGRPLYEQDGDTRHYRIKLRIANPWGDVVSVTYRLDRSYWQPLRYKKNPKNGFEEAITSFGDYEVRADLERSTGKVTRLVASLSRALFQSHKQAKDQEGIRTALEDIREN